MKINEETIEKIGSDIALLLSEHESRIRKAYLNLGDDLTVALSIKFESGKEQAKTSISYYVEKEKDSVTTFLPDRQLPLPFDQTVPVRKCPVSGKPLIDTTCDSCKNRRETITVPGAQMPFIVEEEIEGVFCQHRSCSAWADDDHDDFMTLLQRWPEPQAEEAPKPKVYRLRKRKAAAA